MKVREAIAIAIQRRCGVHAGMAADALRFKRRLNYEQTFGVFKSVADARNLPYGKDVHEELMCAADEAGSSS